MSEGPRILFHTAGDHEIGLGHIVRSLALASAFRELLPHGRVTFRLQGPPEVVARVETRGFSTVADPAPDVLVVDVPQGNPALFRGSSALTISIDDPEASRYEADLAFAMLYEPRAARPRESRTVDFGGLEYVVLNPEFQGLPLHPIAARGNRILICQGGSDTYGMTPPICAALRALGPETVFDVVLGPAFEHDADLKRALGEDRRFHLHRSPQSLRTLMDAADLCVSAAGMTSLELAAVGVPMILVVTEAKEAETASLLVRDGAALFPGGPDQVADGTLLKAVQTLMGDPTRREALSRCAQLRIDGRGAARVAYTILQALESRKG